MKKKKMVRTKENACLDRFFSLIFRRLWRHSTVSIPLLSVSYYMHLRYLLPNNESWCITNTVYRCSIGIELTALAADLCMRRRWWALVVVVALLTCTSELVGTLVELAFRNQSRVEIVARAPGVLEAEEGIRISRSQPILRTRWESTITRQPTNAIVAHSDPRRCRDVFLLLSVTAKKDRQK